jgi:hypothetical protein
MNDMTNMLHIPMQENDANAQTIGEYLRELLLTVWIEEQGFSGKRPFGNSDWRTDVYAALVAAGVVPGELDEDGYLESFNEEAAEDIICSVIMDMR